MPDCPTGNYPARICSLEEAYAQFALGVGHPPMEVTYTDAPYSFNEESQTLNIPVPPVFETTVPSTMLFPSELELWATAPGSLRQLAIVATDAVNGNYSIWVPTALTAGSWSLRVGSMGSQNKSAVTITGGSIVGITDLAVADGGTGASTPTGARVNLANTTLAPVANNFDWALSCLYAVEVSANVTFTFANAADGLDLTVALKMLGSFVPTFPSSILWAGGSAPTHSNAGKTDVYFFERLGGVIYGSAKLAFTT